MKTTSQIKRPSHSNSNLSKPFFRKNGGGSFFPTSEAKTIFFTPGIIQTKLSIGQSRDTYEQEADQMADQIVSSPLQRKSLTSQITPLSAAHRNTSYPIQGKSSQKHMEASNQLTDQINSSKGSGSLMDKYIESEMAQKFGADFSGVRIHTGSESIQMNRELGARAFTVGKDIYFNQGEYHPGDLEGKRLLAHELTHVVQQNTSHHHIQRAPGIGGTADMHEELTRQYSQETGVPYREGLQYTEGYRQWLASKNDSKQTSLPTLNYNSTADMHEELTRQYSQETGVPYREGLQYTQGYHQWLAGQKPTEEPSPQEEKPKDPKHEAEAKKQKDKTKAAVNVGAGVKGNNSIISADGSLKVPLGSPWGEYWKLALKTALFAKWQSSLSGSAKEKLDAGIKVQFDYLDLLVNSENFSLTSGLYFAGSGGYKMDEGKTKSFGSMQTGLTARFIYTGDIWEANVFINGGFSIFDVTGEPLVPGGFLSTGSSIYLRGNIGDEQHKVLLGPVLEGGYNVDSSQETSEGLLNMHLRLMW